MTCWGNDVSICQQHSATIILSTLVSLVAILARFGGLWGGSWGCFRRPEVLAKPTENLQGPRRTFNFVAKSTMDHMKVPTWVGGFYLGCHCKVCVLRMLVLWSRASEQLTSGSAILLVQLVERQATLRKTNM